MLRLRNDRPDDRGASLLIAILFIFAVGVWTLAIVQMAYPDLATTRVVQTNRGSNYDADAALAKDITVIRYTADSSGYPYGTYTFGSHTGVCPNLDYPSGSPTVTVVCTAKQLVDSTPLHLPLPYQREVQLQACSYGSSPCKVLATADVSYYDDGIWGRAAFINDWSTR